MSAAWIAPTRGSTIAVATPLPNRAPMNSPTVTPAGWGRARTGSRPARSRSAGESTREAMVGNSLVGPTGVTPSGSGTTPCRLDSSEVPWVGWIIDSSRPSSVMSFWTPGARSGAASAPRSTAWPSSRAERTCPPKPSEASTSVTWHPDFCRLCAATRPQTPPPTTTTRRAFTSSNVPQPRRTILPGTCLVEGSSHRRTASRRKDCRGQVIAEWATAYYIGYRSVTYRSVGM